MARSRKRAGGPKKKPPERKRSEHLGTVVEPHIAEYVRNSTTLDGSVSDVLRSLIIERMERDGIEPPTSGGAP